MSLQKFSIFGVTLLAFASGVIRFIEIKAFYDHETGLMDYSDNLMLILAGCTLAVLILIFIGSIHLRRRLRKDITSVAFFEAPTAPVLALEVLAALFLIVAAALAFGAGCTAYDITGMIDGALMFLTSCFLLAFTRGKSRRKLGEVLTFAALLPILWACFWLIIKFRVDAVNPTIWYYAFSLFAVIFGLLMIFSAAAFLYRRGSPRKLAIYSLLTVYFSVVSLFQYFSFGLRLEEGILGFLESMLDGTVVSMLKLLMLTLLGFANTYYAFRLTPRPEKSHTKISKLSINDDFDS